MKILHVCLGCFYIDNYSYQENLLSKYHKKLGYEVTVLASLVSFDENGERCYLSNESTYINEFGIKVIRVDYAKPFKKLNRVLRIFNNIYEIISNEKPDIIFIHGCQFWDINKIVKYVRINPSVKIYFDNHADIFNSATNWLSKNILHKIIWKYCAQSIEPYTAKIYGVLPARVEFLLRMYNMPKEKVELLPMGADLDIVKNINRNDIRKIIREKLNIRFSDFVIITGGKIDYKKNIHILIEAVKNINDKNIKLIIFGNPTKEIVNEFNSLIKEENIIFVGWLNSEEVYKYFITSDLAIFPGTHSTLWEEAVGCGIPCVFKLWKGMRHVDLGGNCMFIENISPLEIKKVILNIYKNRNIYNKMKEISMIKGKEIFSYENIARRSIE